MDNLEKYRRPGYRPDYRPPAPAQSFVTPAIITLALYLVLWPVGLGVNIYYWSQANRAEAVAGRAPEGKGCLLALLLVFGGLGLLGCLAAFGLFAVGMGDALTSMPE